LQKEPNEFTDAVRLTDRFYGPQMRGFDIRGIGPRVVRHSVDDDTGELLDIISDDALGGRAYYMGRIELEFPLSAALRNMGLRPSAFVDVGSVWKLTTPELTNIFAFCTPTSTNPIPNAPIVPILTSGTSCPGAATDYIRSPGVRDFFEGNSPKPRLSVGFGVNWVSPFGPLRIDIAKALLKQEGDQTKLFSFNVGTQF
jgi:outer membrane protein insertion porin family